jgi:condensin complex subunit 3
MVTPSQLAHQLLDWTDPRKAVWVYITVLLCNILILIVDVSCRAIEGLVVDHNIQAELAQDILKKIYQEHNKDTRKLFCQLLAKLYIPDEWSIKKIMLLIGQLEMVRYKVALAFVIAELALTTDGSSASTNCGHRLQERLEQIYNHSQ